MFSAKDLFFTPPAGGYTIAKSLRFRSSASAYLSRTPGTAGNRKTFTLSYWMKRGALGGPQYLFAAGSGTTEATWFANAIDTATASDQIGSATWTTSGGYTNASLRDPSAWYHIVIAIDTTQATAANRSKLYVNGVLQTYTGAVSLSLNADLAWNNSGVVHYIGARVDSGPRMFFDGYFADIYNIDGQALDPTYFGQTDTVTGVWMPKKYTGTYGTNGFYLNFSDASGATATTIGKDSSGNGNNWTPTNISVTAGVTYDSMVDTPTNYDNGGNGAGNYCVLNPLDQGNSTAYTANGNLTASGGSSNAQLIYGGMGVSSGKWYWETTITAVGGESSLGISSITEVSNLTSNYVVGSLSTGYGYYFTGNKYNNGSFVSYGSSYTTNDVIGVAFDADTGSLTFYKNNVSQGVAFSSIPAGTYKPAFECRVASGTSIQNVNFGQRPFTYTPPSGFKALCTQNLPTPTIGATSSTLANKYFDVNLWTATGSAMSVTNSAGFQPDLVWAKGRSAAYNHLLYDAVRGVQNELQSNATAAETAQAQGITAFNSNGFSFGTRLSPVAGDTFVGWQWKANGSGSSNTSGSITSTVSANVTAGFSVVTYTGTGANATVGHGLGVAPKMVIVFERSPGGDDHIVYHAALTSNQYSIRLNTTAAQTGPSAAYWNSTSPSSTVFSLGTSGECNQSTATYVAYCFAEVAGYSKFGSYTGNGSADGPFVYCGFRPRYIMLKCSGAVENWQIYDTARDTYNVAGLQLLPNSSAAEASAVVLDILSNGFKLRNSTAGGNQAQAYIYAAFAESPFNYSRAR